MAERLYRTQILLEPDQHRALSEIARQEGRSLSDVVREMVRRQLEHRREDRIRQERLDALERIRRHRDEMLERRGGKPWDVDVAGMINEMREERDADTIPHLEHRR